MKLEKIEQKTAKTGNPYSLLTIDGKSYSWFNELNASVGDNVLCEFEQNGKYTNLASIKRIETTQIGENKLSTQIARHDLIIERKEKPHSYEFGRPNNRFKIYYETIDELKTHIALLKEAGFLDNNEDKPSSP